MKQEQQQESFGDAKAGMNFFLLLITGCASTIQLFLRRPGTCGVKYFGGQAFVGWIFAGLYPAFWERTPGLEAQFAFFLLMIPMLAIHQSAARRSRKQGQRIHSYFIGRSIFQFQPGEKAAKRARGLEFMVCVLGGMLICPFSQSLGTYLILAAFASSLQDSLVAERDRRRIEAMEDALIDQEYYAQQLKERWEDRT
ncbi:MAG: hypothetical protein U0796_02780 [Gemmatales bacterium]